MFKIKRDPLNCLIDGTQASLFGRPAVPLPPELSAIARLGPDWQTYEEVKKMGLNRQKIEALLDYGLACLGHNSSIFPLSARRYFEEQFPKNAGRRPLIQWFELPAPHVIWIGLPFTNLMSIRHSTALGMADILDALAPKDDYFLAALPYFDPCKQSELDLINIVHTISNTPSRLGLLGGDHRATWALLRARKKAYPEECIRYVHIDAHHDLYGVEKCEDPPVIAHSNFLIDLFRKNIIDEAVLIGCRDRSDPIKSAQEQGFQLSALEDAFAYQPQNTEPRLHHRHLSIDLDVLDPMVATSVTSPIAEGWSKNKLMETIAHLLFIEDFDSFTIVEAGQSCHKTAQIACDLIQMISKGKT